MGAQSADALLRTLEKFSKAAEAQLTGRTLGLAATVTLLLTLIIH